MFGKKWDKLWACFDKTMDALPDAIDEAVRGGGVFVNGNGGNIVIKGRVKSLRINGRLIRLPDEVMRGKL